MLTTEASFFQKLADNSPLFIGMCDMTFTPFYLNDAGRRLIGLEGLKHFRETPVKECFFPEDQNFILNEFFPRVLRFGRADTEIRFRHFKTGEAIWMTYDVFTLLDESGTAVGLATVSRDIRERKRTEEMLREADRRKDEFLAMLAHELRNPLAPIRTGLDLLQSGVDGPKAAKLLSTMARQVDHLVRLVDDLLDVSRFSRGLIELRKERIDLAEVVNDSIAASQSLIAAHGHVLTVSLAPEPLPLDGDPTRLAQVVTNLLNNAAKFTSPGGRIEVSTRLRDGEAELSVRDNGVGIQADKLACVFDLFTQIDGIHDPNGGLGIGLAMVRGLVEMHGGRVEAHSAGLGQGSEFTVRLPLAEGGSPDRGDRIEAQAPAGAMRRILVVDDARDIADVLVMLLETLDADVRVAYDGKSAIDIVKAFKPDIVFLDIGMPVMDGCETARQIRRLPEGKDILLVALTGWGQEQDRLRTSEAGFDKHFVKPVSFEQVQALLAERR